MIRFRRGFPRGFEIVKVIFEREWLLQNILKEDLESYRSVHEQIYQKIKDLPYDILLLKPNLYSKIQAIGDAFIQVKPLQNFAILKTSLDEDLV
jgi:hypothetical protein